MLDPSDLSYSCLNSALISRKDPLCREAKDELFRKLNTYIVKNKDYLAENADIKTIQQFLIGASANKIA